MDINSICMALMLVKQREAEEKARRIGLEQQIIGLVKTKQEGTTTTNTGQYKVSVTTKMNRELDYEKYQALGLPENLEFVDLKPAINMTRLRHIEAVDPSIVASCVTTKPAKPSVKVEEVLV